MFLIDSNKWSPSSRWAQLWIPLVPEKLSDVAFILDNTVCSYRRHQHPLLLDPVVIRHKLFLLVEPDYRNDTPRFSPSSKLIPITFRIVTTQTKFFIYCPKYHSKMYGHSQPPVTIFGNSSQILSQYIVEILRQIFVHCTNPYILYQYLLLLELYDWYQT